MKEDATLYINIEYWEMKAFLQETIEMSSKYSIKINNQSSWILIKYGQASFKIVTLRWNDYYGASI